MKSCYTYMMVATLAVAGMGMSASAADNMGNTPGNSAMNNNTAQMQNGTGQAADESGTKAARSTLAKIVNDAVETDKFSSLSSYLAKADRQRLGDVKHTNVDDLNNVIKQFRQDFKSKYNQDFDISAEQLSNAMVYAGQDKNSATVTLSKPMMSSTPGDTTGGMNSTSSTNNMTGSMGNNANMNTAGTTGTTGATSDRTLNTTGTDQTVSNRSGDNSGAGLTSTSAGNRTGTATNGSNSNSTVHGNDVTATPGVVAGDANTMATNTNTNSSTSGTNSMNSTSSVSSSNLNAMANANGVGMSSLTLNLVNEGHVMNAWRISNPQISAEQLKQNLVKHIQMLDDQKAAWPSDVNAAYQKVAYHVLSSFNDTAVASER